MDVQELSDRLEIGELLARYALAVDHGDWDLLDTVFTPDALIDFTASGGGRGDRAEIKRWLAETLKAWPGRLHLIASTTITVDGDSATVTAAFADTLSPTRAMTAADTPGLIHGGGRYQHRLTRTGDGWRSRELVQEQAWRTIG